MKVSGPRTFLRILCRLAAISMPETGYTVELPNDHHSREMIDLANEQAMKKLKHGWVTVAWSNGSVGS